MQFQGASSSCKLPAGSIPRGIPSRGASVQYEDEYEKSNGSLQVVWSALMTDGDAQSSSRYQKVKVLMISFHKSCDDLGAQEEVMFSRLQPRK